MDWYGFYLYFHALLYIIRRPRCHDEIINDVGKIKRKQTTTTRNKTWNECVFRVIYCPRLTHWGRVTHICVGKLTIIDSDNGLSPGRRQAIIWPYAGILLIWPLGTKFSEMLNEIHIFSFKKMHLNMSSAKPWPFCLGLNVLTAHSITIKTKSGTGWSP